MAIYNTFFLSDPQELLGGFPGWRPPLPEPVKREIRNPFTKQLSVIETREPAWPDEGVAQPFSQPFKAIAIQGSYEDYLEGRLPPFLRDRPHWCSKGLTDVELDPLGEAMGLRPVLEFALYSRPSSGATLQQLRTDLVLKLVALDKGVTEVVATRWAGIMSKPEYTHSVSGRKLNDGWTAQDAMRILQPVVTLAKQSDGRILMYLLTEA